MLVGSEGATSEPEEFEVAGRFRIARVEMFPGRTPLRIMGAGWERRLRPRVTPEFVMQRGGGDRIEASDGQAIYFGETLSVHAYIPVAMSPGAGLEGDGQIAFQVQCPDNPALTPRHHTGAAVNVQGVFQCHDLTATLVGPFLASLPAGIHRIQVLGEGQARLFSLEFQYWKGLRYVSAARGFVCARPPENLNLTHSTGVLCTASGLELDPSHTGAEFTLVLRQPERVLRIPKPGLWVQVADSLSGERRYIALGEDIEVNAAGMQSVTFTSGDTQPWDYSVRRCGDRDPSGGRLRAVLQLPGLLGQFGGNGRSFGGTRRVSRSTSSAIRRQPWGTVSCWSMDRALPKCPWE